MRVPYPSPRVPLAQIQVTPEFVHGQCEVRIAGLLSEEQPTSFKSLHEAALADLCALHGGAGAQLEVRIGLRLGCLEVAAGVHDCALDRPHDVHMSFT
jgi:hypothetical protein